MSQITNYGTTGPLAIQANGTFQSSTDTSLATLVGTRWTTSDGRELILVSTSSATTTTPGQLYQDPAVVANHQNLTVTAVQAYANNGNTPATVTVTLGATALTANQYQGGFLLVNSSTGIGQTLRIASNPAALSSATGVVITLEDGPNVALTTSSTVCLLPAHGANVIQMPTTASNVPVGIAMYAIAPSSYGFLVSKGIVAAFSDSTAPTAGSAIAASLVTAGNIGVGTATGTNFGYAIQASTSAQARGIWIDV